MRNVPRHDDDMEDTPKGAARRPRSGWQRVTPQQTEQRAARATFRSDAPSPVEEILAKHDAELDEHNDDGEDEATSVFCF